MIKEHVKLGFDPFNSPQCPDLKTVFENPLAEQLWLGIRQNHLINQYFEQNILDKAKRFQEYLDKKKPITPKLVRGVLGSGIERRHLPADIELCEGLVPFICGDKKITYEIEIGPNSTEAPPFLTPEVKLKTNVLGTSCLISLAIMKGIKEVKRGKIVRVYDLAGYLIRLKTKGIDISRISMSISAGMIWSEDIAKYVTQSEVMGKMKQYRDEHIWFTDECYDECLSALKSNGKNNPNIQPVIKKAMRTLNLEIFN